MRVLAIDPGLSGALAYYDVTGQPVYVKMPRTMEAQWQTIEELWRRGSPVFDTIVCERVGTSRPGNSAHSSSVFAEHVGGLKMVFVALGVQPVMVMPTTWMDTLGPGRPKGNTSADKAKRKAWIYEKMVAVYPDAKIPKYAADAVMICWYATQGRGTQYA